MNGQNISHYRVIEKPGGWGMSVVYKAEDTKQPEYFVAHGREFLQSGAKQRGADDDGTTVLSDGGLPCQVLYKKPQSQMEG